MSITRYEVRKITEDKRGQSIISQAVVHGNVTYLAGITPDPIVGDIKAQTAQVLRRIDELLKLAGTANQTCSAPRSGSPTCGCSRVTMPHGTSGSIRRTLRCGLASRPTSGGPACLLKSWWLLPCHERRQAIGTDVCYFQHRPISKSLRSDHVIWRCGSSVGVTVDRRPRPVYAQFRSTQERTGFGDAMSPVPVTIGASEILGLGPNCTFAQSSRFTRFRLPFDELNSISIRVAW